ncbi:MAG: hypothetical protein AB8H80_23825 [Planctomycetota bacterium]
MRRRLAFALVLVGIVLLLVELGGFAAWWAMTGTPFSWSAASEQRALAVGTSGRSAADNAARAARQPEADGGAREQDAVQQAVNSGPVVHPFLGYVTDARAESIAGFPISSYGFVDDASPLQTRGEDRYVVGIVGGSVALQLALYAEDVLRRELAKSPAAAGRRIEFVRLALGGYKQPQQVFAAQLAWLRGGEFDLLLNIDGFNEVALVRENVPLGVPGWFPRGWARLMDTTPTVAQQRRIARLVVAREDRVAAARTADGVWWSPTLQCLWLFADRRSTASIQQLAAEVERADGERSFAATGPGPEGRSQEGSRTEMVGVWQRASRQLQRLCELHGTRYFHFLQPNQYVPGSKPIGVDEAKIAFADGPRSYRPAVEHGYPLLRAAGAELRQVGVPFTDLTDVFAGRDEPLYVDSCCHFGRRGNELLAIRIASVVRRALDLQGFVASSVAVQPSPLQLATPWQVVPLDVQATSADGRSVDVAAKALGTRYECNPADLLEVDEAGRVRATRRGRGTLRVRSQGGADPALAAAAEIEVVAEWPNQLAAADGWLADPIEGAEPPVLRAVGEVSGSEPPQLHCTGLSGGAFRVLCASAKPLPANVRPGQEAFGIATALLPAAAADSGTVSATAPAAVPAGGQPLFLRVYLVDLAGDVVATSNTLVLTRR